MMNVNVLPVQAASDTVAGSTCRVGGGVGGGGAVAPN
jgi:hypothetical protein